jgi:hypothetical protein
MQWMTTVGRGIFAMSLAACGATPPLGSLPADITRTFQKTQGVQRVNLYLTTGGKVRSVAVYHTDLKEIPAAVQALGAERFPNRQVLYYETEHHADGLIYEIEYALDNGLKGELAARADGTLVYVEQPVATLPDVVRAAALKRVPGQVVGRERQLGPGLDHYGVKIQFQDRLHVVLLKPDGRIVRHGVRIPAKLEVTYEPPK